MRLSALHHGAHDRLCNDISWRQIFQGVQAFHDVITFEIQNRGAFSAQRFANQRLLPLGGTT